jgi:hypothetical protein
MFGDAPNRNLGLREGADHRLLWRRGPVRSCFGRRGEQRRGVCVERASFGTDEETQRESCSRPPLFFCPDHRSTLSRGPPPKLRTAALDRGGPRWGRSLGLSCSPALVCSAFGGLMGRAIFSSSSVSLSRRRAQRRDPRSWSPRGRDRRTRLHLERRDQASLRSPTTRLVASPSSSSSPVPPPSAAVADACACRLSPRVSLLSLAPLN